MVLAKFGLGKAELGRLWVLSDVDQDGALSKVEFSIAMHLASCSAHKKIPVPRALPWSLAVLLPTGGNKAHAVAAAAEEVAEAGTAKAGEHGDSDQRQHSTNARGANGEKSGTKPATCSDRAGENQPEAIGNDAGVKTGGTGGDQRGNKRRENKTVSGREAKDKRLQQMVEAAIPENETRPSKKRGFGTFFSPAGAAKTSKPLTADKDKAASKFSSLPDASGDQKKKRPKKAGSGDEQKEKKVGKKVGKKVTIDSGKRKHLPTDRKTGETGSKPLTSKSSKSGTEDGRNSGTAGERDGVVAGSDSVESLARKEKGEGHGTGEGGKHGEKHKLAGACDDDGGGEDAGIGDDDGGGDDDEDDENAGEEEAGDTPEKTVEKKVKKNMKKPLSIEERDQQYSMTTSERAGYDVVFMQVLAH